MSNDHLLVHRFRLTRFPGRWCKITVVIADLDNLNGFLHSPINKLTVESWLQARSKNKFHRVGIVLMGSEGVGERPSSVISSESLESEVDIRRFLKF